MALISSDANISAIALVEQGGNPATPAAGKWKLYIKATGLFLVDDNGTVYGPFAQVGSEGDMFKANYDSNADNKVNAADAADAAPWSGISDKPSTFTPSAHTHVVDDVTDFPATMPPDAHTHVVVDITDFPATMPPDAHTHGVIDITDFPATMPPSAHTHPSGEIDDFAEAVDDRIGALLAEGTNITLTYDDNANTLTIAAAGGGASALADLTDVNVTTPAAGDVLTWDDTPGEWVATAPTGGASTLDALTDVNAPAPNNGDVLTWDSTPGEWVAAEPSGGAGNVAADAIWDAKGDLAVGTGANTAAKLTVGANGKLLAAASGETTGLIWTPVTKLLSLGVPGVLAVATGTFRLYTPWACTITNVIATVSVAPTGASLIVDVNINGATAFSTQDNRPTITATNFTDTASVPDVTTVAQYDYITIDVDQVGSTIAGSDLVVMVEVTVP